MTPRREALLEHIADGALHSGADLAAGLGISRAAVWKIVGDLRTLGVGIESVPRRGYRLPQAVELLAADRIRGAARERGIDLAADLEVLFATESTNQHLYGAPPPPPGRPRVTFAELQSAGRGRRGRRWLAPFGSGLTFSVAWTFAETPADLPALGLAIGVAAAEALRRAGGDGIGVKWPNDLVWQRRKLGGLLLQLRSETGGPATIVAGLGVNLQLTQAARRALDAAADVAVADLVEACGGRAPPRNRVAAELAGAVLAAFAEFSRAGFAGFAARWAALDALAGAEVRVVQGGESVAGIARGAAADGALQLEVGGRLERFYSGDVSLRPRSGPP